MYNFTNSIQVYRSKNIRGQNTLSAICMAIADQRSGRQKVFGALARAYIARQIPLRQVRRTSWKTCLAVSQLTDIRHGSTF